MIHQSKSTACNKLLKYPYLFLSRFMMVVIIAMNGFTVAV